MITEKEKVRGLIIRRLRRQVRRLGEGVETVADIMVNYDGQRGAKNLRKLIDECREALRRLQHGFPAFRKKVV